MGPGNIDFSICIARVYAQHCAVQGHFYGQSLAKSPAKILVSKCENGDNAAVKTQHLSCPRPPPPPTPWWGLACKWLLHNCNNIKDQSESEIWHQNSRTSRTLHVGNTICQPALATKPILCKSDCWMRITAFDRAITVNGSFVIAFRPS